MLKLLKNNKKIKELEKEIKNLEYQCNYERREKCKYKEKYNELLEQIKKNKEG